MSEPLAPPSFDEFTRWLAHREALPGTAPKPERYPSLLAAGRLARDETLRARNDMPPDITTHQPGRLEVLQLLAAASREETGSRPPELTTARGFRVTLAYDEGSTAAASSICVLVRCPPALVDRVQGRVVYLWNGAQRFELGQFDVEGKAIGTLPAGIEIAMTDFALGRVKLEEPPENE